MSIPAYLILGSPASGRCGICADVIFNALGESDFCGVFISKNELKTDFDKKIASAPIAGFVNYADWRDAADKIDALDESRITHVFYIADSTKNLADEIEDFKKIVDIGKIRLARIWSVLDCATLSRYPNECMPYADALAHFADCLLLSRRSGVGNKDVENIKARYEKMCHPHMYEYVGLNFELKHPIEMLIEEARRISIFFDDYDPIDELDIDGDNIPEEPFNLERKTDLYMSRLQNGLREKPVPDISEYAFKTRAAEAETK